MITAAVPELGSDSANLHLWLRCLATVTVP